MPVYERLPSTSTTGGGAPTGAAGGDLSGTYPNPTITGLSADKTADGTTNKVYTATEKTKLAGVAAAATANSSDAALLARANHTGTESADVITDGTTNKAYTATEKTKLAGIATAATANSTDAAIQANAVLDMLKDPLGYGFACSTSPLSATGSANLAGSANAAAFGLFLGYGQSVSTLRIVVGTSSGNISVGVYSGSGTGSARVPTSRRETTGAIACPASGAATVTLGSTITINKGDYAALSVDNSTATFARSNPAAITVSLGAAAFTSSGAHPLPTSSGAANGSTVVPFIATP